MGVRESPRRGGRRLAQVCDASADGLFVMMQLNHGDHFWDSIAMCTMGKVLLKLCLRPKKGLKASIVCCIITNW